MSDRPASVSCDRTADPTSSYVWDLDEATWAERVQPVIDALRTLPDPDRPRDRVHRHLLSAYRRR